MKEDVSSDIDRSNKSESEENEDKKNKDAQPQEQKNQKKESLFNWKWTARIFLLTFSISIGLSLFSESVSEELPVWVAFIILCVFVFIGILFDIIGTAVMSADPKSLNSMCTRQVKGAKKALKWVQSADTVANFCNDVMGDISSVLSGSVGSVIAIGLADTFNFSKLISAVVVTALTSAITVAGKSFGKNFAMKKANDIIFFFARLLSVFGEEKSKKKKK